MRDFKSRVTTLALLSSFISPLSLVYSRAAVVGNRPLLANDWVGEQMAKIKEQTSLVDAFRRVEKLTGYRIMYSYDDVKNYKAQSMPSSKDIHKALSQVLGNLPLDFTINGKFVSISKKAPQVSNISTSLGVKEGQTVVLQGMVVDENGEPLPGVTVQAGKNSKIATVTNTDGTFVLQLNRGRAVNVDFSYIGMKSEHYMFKCLEDFRNLVIKLKDDASSLKEVVVTGMFNKRRETYTGSAKTVTSKDLKLAGNSNLLSSLSNVDPSFNIVTNDLIGSDPNKLPDITMRGSTALGTDVKSMQNNSSNKVSSNLPLFIMDGFEVSLERFNDLDENQVESITLLKDASATALYGTRGANGVVVITTKKPESGRLRVTYKGTLTVEAPDLTGYNLMNADEKLKYEKQAGLYTAADDAKRQQSLDNLYNARMMNAARGIDTYWLKYPIRTGVGHKHSLRVEGGDDVFRYSGNLLYNDINGAMKGSARNTFTGGVFLSYKYKNLTFQNDLQISSNTSKNSPYGSFSDYTSVNPYYTPFGTDGNYAKKLEDDTSYPSLGLNSRVTVYNPLYNAMLPQKNESKYTSITNNFAIEWHLNDAFFMRGSLGVTSEKNRSDVYVPAENTAFDEYATSDYGRKGTYTYGTGENSQYELNITANYSKTFADLHSLYVGLGYTLAQTKSEDYSFQAEGITNSNMAFLGAATAYAQGTTPYGYESTVRRVGVTGNFNYTYADRYFVDGTFKTEGSSQFGKDNRFAPFFSIGAGWNIHNEHFLKGNNFINVARLRLSYGTSGSQSFSPYQALTSYKTIDGYNFNGLYGVKLMGIGNSELKWQKTKQWNVGFDLELIKNRFALNFDYYNKLTDDLLSDVNLPTSAGFSSFKGNVGQVENRGFELGANAYLIRDTKRQVIWSVGGTMIHNVNKIKKISNYLEYLNSLMENEEDVNPSFMYKEGESINTIFAVRSQGIDPSNGKEIYVKKDGTLTYVWDSKDKVACGISEPKYQGTFNTRLRYQGWQLSAIFSYRFGGQIYNSTLASKIENNYPYNNSDRRALYDRWSPENTNARYKAINDFSTTYATSRFVEDENTLRLNTLSLSYDLPATWLKKVHLPFEYVSIAGYAEDLLYMSSVKRERGTDYPYARTYTFSLTLRF